MPSLPSLEMFTRVGFAARGVMYVVIGYLALRFGQTESGEGALAALAEGSGKLLLGIMALGFAAYGVWRLSEALVDTEGHGSDVKGSAARIGGALSGLIHLGLALVAANLAFGRSGQGSGGGGGQSGAEQGAATALALPGGPLLLLVAGAALIGAGLWQLVKAAKADFLRHLDGRVAAQPWVMWLGRAGYAARGLVFVIIGWSLLRLSDGAGRSRRPGAGARLTVRHLADGGCAGAAAVRLVQLRRSAVSADQRSERGGAVEGTVRA
jgi:hypothetical protein